MTYSRIAGTGRYLPEKILTNFDLEKMVDTSDEWIRTRTGVERRHCVAPDETTSDMCVSSVTDSGKRSWIADHLDHAVKVGGEDAVAIGTDYDGLIVPPVDLPDVTAHPLIIQDLLDRKWPEERIRKVLGLNYLRVVAAVRE